MLRRGNARPPVLFPWRSGRVAVHNKTDIEMKDLISVQTLSALCCYLLVIRVLQTLLLCAFLHYKVVSSTSRKIDREIDTAGEWVY